jgi:HPt (histidine-containing phosphotransfer) domain-containing protein
MPATDLIDRAVLKALLDSFGGDLDFFAELLDSYFVDAPRLLSEMRQAVVDNQPPQLQMSAHSLKSVSATFGAMRLAALCKDLEIMGRTGTVHGAAELTPQVEAEYARVHAALETIRATGSQRA